MVNVVLQENVPVTPGGKGQDVTQVTESTFNPLEALGGQH